MLTKHDEFLCHQLPLTFDTVSQSAVQWTERMWLCFFDTSGKVHCSSGFGKYSNRNILDGFVLLSTLDGKTQYNVRASRELRPQIDDVKVGPLSYAVIAGLLLMDIPLHRRVPLAGSARAEIGEGFRFVRRTSPVRALLLLLGVVSLMGIPYVVLMPIFADRILHGGARGLGLLMGASGLGRSPGP